MSTCTNGPCWTISDTATPPIGTSLYIYSSAVKDGVYVVGGNSVDIFSGNGTSLIQYSLDGSTWTNVNFGPIGSNVNIMIAAGGIFFLTQDAANYRTSADGINWSGPIPFPRLVETSFPINRQPLSYAAGHFMLPTLSGTYSPDYVLYNPDGGSGNWNQVPMPFPTSQYASIFASGNGVIVGAGDFGISYATSITGTWTPFAIGYIRALVFGDGKFVAARDNDILTSTDGITWTTYSGVLPYTPFGMLYSQDRFIAWNRNSGDIMISADAITWTVADETVPRKMIGPTPVGIYAGLVGLATDDNGNYLGFSTSFLTDDYNYAVIGLCPCSTPITYGDWWASISNTVIKNISTKQDLNPKPPEQAILLLPGADNISFNNNVFLDSSETYYVNRISNPTQGTYNPYKSSAYTVGSMYFDGNLDCLYIDTVNNSNNIPTYEPDGLVLQDSWTIESWVYFSDFDAQNWAPHIFSFGSDFPLRRFTLFKNGYSSGQFSFYSRIDDNEYLIDCTTVPVANTWYHTAVVKNGNTIGIYINGILEATTTNPVDPVCRYLFIATYKDEPPGGDLRNFVKGFISNFRVVNGSAVYTSNFTPPTQPVDIIPGTVLLLNAVNSGVYDQTFNNDIETAGTTARTAGNVYFAGNVDDQLILPANTKYNLGTSDYTIDFWFYKTSARFENVMVMNSGADFSIGLDTTGFQIALNAAAQSFPCSVNLNTWYYFSMIRQKGVVRLYLNDTMVGSVISAGQNGYGDKTLTIGGPDPTFTGYIRDFRIVKNRSKPPTPPPPPPTNRYRLAFSAGPTYAPANNSTWSVDLDISPETWNIITITQTPDAKVRFYINTVEVPALPGSLQQLSGFYPGTQYLGRADNFWWGRIGYWQVYNAALTPAQIAQNFEATKGRFGFPAGSGSVVLENMVLYVDATAGFTPVVGNTLLNNNNVSVVGGNYFDFNGVDSGIDILNPDLYNVPWTAGKTVMMPVWFDRNVQVGYRAMLGAPGVSALQDRIVNVYLEVLPL